jgi:hypothetical protein
VTSMFRYDCAPCLLSPHAPLSRSQSLRALCVQFQAKLKAFKSKTLTFEELLEGVRPCCCCTRVPVQTRLLLSRPDVARLLHAEKDPALFERFGCFVPSHHKARWRALLLFLFPAQRLSLLGSSRRMNSAQSVFDARLEAFKKQGAAVTRLLSAPLLELPGLKRLESRDAGADELVPSKRFMRAGACSRAWIIAGRHV